MSIFGRQTPGPTQINRVQINQSVLGYPVPVVMGRGKVQQSIMWADDFNAQLITTGGGKGFGGGKDGNQFVYTADVIAGLCAGPIIGIGDVWSGQSWLQNTNATESYTITGGSPTYTPVNVASLTADQGVAHLVAYSASVTDLGAPSTVTLSGSHLVPFKRVPYASGTPASKTYSMNASGQYIFSPADAGVTVQLSYSFDLTVVSQQVKSIIPAGRQIPCGSSATGSSGTPWVADGGVVYYSESGSEVDNGVPLTYVGGSPSATGTYSYYGTVPAFYEFAPGDVGKEVLITYKLNVSNTLEQGTQWALSFTLFEGNLQQSVWSLLTTNYPGAALGYSGIAFAAYAPMNLGYGDQIQENTFEVLTPDGWGAGINDCSPVQCISQVLTNPVWGLGAGMVPFPASVIDLVTWGIPAATGATRQDSTAVSWFAANGFFISPVIDKQDTAASLISKWLEAGQAAMFMSEGLLKMVPYGDTSTAGNGAIWIAPSAFVVALDDTCFIAKDGADPVKISSTPWMDAFNVVQISWKNRANQYADEITPQSDQAAINRYGSRIEDPLSYDFITTLPAAAFAASLRVKRNVYNRNTYEFTLGYRYSYLEPMDVVYITTSSIWAANLNNESLNIVDLPVRITKVVDNPDGTLDITAEDYPFGAHQPVIYNKAIAAGATQPNMFALPGNTEAVIFEATDRLTGYTGDQIWIGAAGSNASWGGCNILVSMDGDKYVQLGSIQTPARIGELGAALASGSDPDTTDSLVINLIAGSNGLEAGTTTDADQDNTLCFVDGELISYSACAVTGEDQYTATGYLRRGQMGSAISSHASGSLFARLDSAIFKYTYDPSWYGKTVYLKFQSFNVYGNSAQDPAGLTAVEFTVPGLNPGTVDASTGLIIGFNSKSLPPNVANNTGNTCVLSTVWDSTSGTATINGCGPGGAGTSWEFLTGQGNVTYPAFTLTGLAGGVDLAVSYDTETDVFGTQDAYSATLPDYLVRLGAIVTATATVAGTGGGGGSTGGDGGGPPNSFQ